MSRMITSDSLEVKILFDNKELEEKVVTPYYGVGMKEITCMNCGRSYFVKNEPMSICTMPCPFCGVDMCNPTC